MKKLLLFLKGRKPKKFSPRVARVLAAAARKPGMTARKVLTSTGVNVSLRTVQRALSTLDYIVFGHLKPRPQLTPATCLFTLRMGEENVVGGPYEWRRTVFTDEKRFCLDDPDETACYWRYYRLPRPFFSKRQNGGGCYGLGRNLLAWAVSSGS